MTEDLNKLQGALNDLHKSIRKTENFYKLVEEMCLIKGIKSYVYDYGIAGRDQIRVVLKIHMRTGEHGYIKDFDMSIKEDLVEATKQIKEMLKEFKQTIQDSLEEDNKKLDSWQ